MSRTMPITVASFRPDGTTLDLLNPHPGEVSIEGIAAALSRINRFNGASACGGYSDAQHCVMGAEALLNEGAPSIIAAFFLLHDAHEFVLGDWTRPAQDAIFARMAAIADDRTVAVVFKNAMLSLKLWWDDAIYFAFDLPRPAVWTKADTATVKRMDEAMLAAEARALFPRGDKLYPLAKYPQPKLRGAITPWGAAKAEERFIDLAKQLIGQDRIDAARRNHLAHLETIANPAKRRRIGGLNQ